MKALILLLFISCSTSSFLIKQNELLPYKESSQVTKISNVNKMIKISSIVDKRDVIHYGKAYTGVQYDETPITFDVSLKKLVEDYLINSFELRNIFITSDGELKMDIEVNEIWVEEIIEKFQSERAKCRANLTFHVNGANQKWSGNFWAEFTSAGDLSDGSERLAPSLASCLNEIIEKVVSDNKFVEILK